MDDVKRYFASKVPHFLVELGEEIQEAFEIGSLERMDERWLWLGGTWAVCILLAIAAKFMIPQEYGIFSENKKLFFDDDDPTTDSNGVPPVESVGEDFDYTKEEPIKHRPFKPGKYTMTMGLQKCSHNQWFQMESTYVERVQLRRDTIAANPGIAVFCEPGAEVAGPVAEFYDKTMRFLVKRYPMYFSENVKTGHVINRVFDNERYPLSGVYALKHGYKPYDLLRILSRNVEEDFLIMTFDETSDPPMYRLRAGSSCFPAGFNPKLKCGLTLRDIHGPVPMYGEKLETSMNKFFKRIEPHNYVQRQNWGIQRGTTMFAIGEYHVYDQDKVKVYKDGEIDFSQWFLRCENQILTRLPSTKALAFVIRTYVTPVTEIKEEEGVPESLCAAIDALPEEIHVYKGAQEWAPPLKRFLRGEIDSLGVPVEK